MFQFYPFKTAQVAITSAATLISAANSARSGIIITNLGTTDLYIGDVNVTTGTGDLLVGTKGATKAFSTTSAVYAISGTTGSVSVLETQ